MTTVHRMTLPSSAVGNMRRDGFPFDLNLPLGSSYRIQSSTNMTQWTDLTNFTGTGAPFPFTDATATNRARTFYRIVSP
jgi:hypothetical protein